MPSVSCIWTIAPTCWINFLKYGCLLIAHCLPVHFTLDSPTARMVPEQHGLVSYCPHWSDYMFPSMHPLWMMWGWHPLGAFQEVAKNRYQDGQLITDSPQSVMGSLVKQTPPLKVIFNSDIASLPSITTSLRETWAYLFTPKFILYQSLKDIYQCKHLDVVLSMRNYLQIF